MVPRLAMQDEAALLLDGATDEYRVVCDLRVVAFQLHLGEDIAQAVLGHLVDQQADRAVFPVLAQEGDAARERRLGEGGHRDEELTRECSGDRHGRIVAATDGRVRLR
jgi:hypothetical protein